jgi:hypothetical protein
MKLIHIRKGHLYIKSDDKTGPSFTATIAHGLLAAPVPAHSSPYLDINLLHGFLFCPEDGSSNFS